MSRGTIRAAQNISLHMLLLIHKLGNKVKVKISFLGFIQTSLLEAPQSKRISRDTRYDPTRIIKQLKWHLPLC